MKKRRRLHPVPNDSSPVSYTQAKASLSVPNKLYFRKRIYGLAVLFLLLGLAIVAKLLYIQVWDADRLKGLAFRSHGHKQVVFNRGKVLDRHGVILAQDTLLYDLYVHPRYYWKLTPHAIAQATAGILKRNPAELEAFFSQRLPTLNLGKDIHKSVVDQLKALRVSVPVTVETHGKKVTIWQKYPLSGFDYVKKTFRNYPQGTLAAHVLGYVNDDANIASGIEANTLKNNNRFQQQGHVARAATDGRGNWLHIEQFQPQSLVKAPVAKDIQLTLDARLQHIAERELAAGVAKSKARRGSVIMLDPTRGEILAFAVLPTYNPRHYHHVTAETLKNWAITDVYPPGSTFKIITVASALEAGVIDENTQIYDTGKMKLGDWTIQNADYNRLGAPGMIDLVYLFQHSSNIGSAKIALLVPPQMHRDQLVRFGFNRKTGIDLPGESIGLLPGVKDWNNTFHASLGYGYGIATTPMQVASAVGAIANHGLWIQPHLTRKPDNQIPRKRVLSAKTSRMLSDILARSIETNDKHKITLPGGIRVAGKTGTSRKPKENGSGYEAHGLYTSFIGYYPAENPKVLMMVVVDSPQIAEAWGSTVAAPIFTNIAKESLQFFQLQSK